MTLLTRRQLFVREKVALVKLTDEYDLLDPETGALLGTAREEPPGYAKFLRLVISKALLPTAVRIYEGVSPTPVLSISRPPSLWRAKVTVTDATGTSLGHFESKLFSIGGGFWVFDAQGQKVAEVRGDWKGWNFKFLDPSGAELGTVTKKWAGVGRELFTTADNYMIVLGDAAPRDPRLPALLLSAGLAIDIVFKEKDG